MHVSDVQRHTMFKPISRIAAAAVIAGVFVFLTSVAPKANVPGDGPALPQASSAKSERLPGSVKGAACSQRAWPNFEQSCQFDLIRPANQARSVRVLALSRLK